MKRSKKKIAGVSAGLIAILIIGTLILVFVLRIDSGKAESIAMEQAGGGQIVSREISRDGLWNEYSYVIHNGEQWYEIEIGGFGQVDELKSGPRAYTAD